MVAVVWWLLKATRLGLIIRAVGENHDAAHALGYKVSRIDVGRDVGSVLEKLKPDVVFFGDSVPRPVVDAAWELLARAEVLLVAGSSLTVYSGFRFVRRAAEQKVPVAIVNLGPTRGDPLAQLRIDARLGDFLPALADRLHAQP